MGSNVVRHGVPGQGLRSKPQGRQKKIKVDIACIEYLPETILCQFSVICKVSQTMPITENWHVLSIHFS